MQFEKDINGEFKDIFITLRDIVLSFSDIKEIQNAKQTSYRDNNSMVVMMRAKKDKFVLSFGKGVALSNKYPMLLGDAKIVKHLYFKTLKDIDKKLIQNLIEETIILNIEASEKKSFLKQLKKL